MKIVFFVMGLYGLLMAQAPSLPEATAAIVNGIAITDDELNKEIGKELPRTYYHATLNDEKLSKLKKKALQSLIEKTLLYQYARSQNIKVTDDEIDDVMDTLAEAYGSKSTLEKAFRQLGFTPKSFRKAIEKDEVLKKLYTKEIEVHIDESELKRYYDTNRYKFKEPEKIRVRLIHVRNDPKDPKGKQKAKAAIDAAYKELKEGADFADVAAKYSTAMSRIKGGDMGYLHKGRLDAAVEEKAFAMDVNTTSDIIEDTIGYFIVKVEDKLEPNQLSFEQVKKSLKKDLKKRREKERKAALLKKLMATAVIVK